MKLVIAAAVAILLSANVNGQKILLKIASITSAAGEEVKAADFKVDAASGWGGGGSQVGKAIFQKFMIKKQNGLSTNELYKRVLLGTIIPAVVVEYYDAANTLYFTITLKSVFVTGFYWLSPECPTCLKMEHQISFVPRQIETFDVATGVTVKFDVSTNAIYN